MTVTIPKVARMMKMTEKLCAYEIMLLFPHNSAKIYNYAGMIILRLNIIKE